MNGGTSEIAIQIQTVDRLTDHRIEQVRFERVGTSERTFQYV